MLRSEQYTKTQIMRHFRIDADTLAKLMISAQATVASGRYTGDPSVGESAEPIVGLGDVDPSLNETATLADIDINAGDASFIEEDEEEDEEQATIDED